MEEAGALANLRQRQDPQEFPLPRTKRRKAALPPAEIKRINKNRRKNLKKARKRTVGKHPALAAPYGRKNPNRPLELKNQLNAVVATMSALPNTERVAFAAVMNALGDISRSGRKRVLEALAQVYA